MKKGLLAVLFVFLSSNLALAEKLNYIGLSSFAVGVEYTLPGYTITDDDFSGGAITYQRALNHNAAFSGRFYSTKHDQYSSDKLTGYSVALAAGNNFDQVGFKIYGLIGYFSETLDSEGYEFDFSGLEVGLGLGYNWESVSLEIAGTGRDSSSYENEFENVYGITPDITASSGALTLSMRY